MKICDSLIILCSAKNNGNEEKVNEGDDEAEALIKIRL